MKIDCCKIVIDKHKIIQTIDDYYYAYAKVPSYIIMNQETYDRLNSEIVSELLKCPSPCVSKMYDIPIAVSDNLRFGEIDIV